MFRKRHERTAERTAAEAHTEVDDDRGRKGEFARGVTRGVMTLLGAAAAGLLVWLATQVGDDSTGGYWAVYGLLAAAGLALALSQLLGGWTKWGLPKLSAAVFLLGFLPVLIAGGWLLLAHQPGGGGFRNDVLNWSDDLGIGAFVDDVREYLPVVAFAIGLVFGFTFDTKGPRVRRETAVERRREVEPAPVEEHAVADEPLTAERRSAPVATSDPDGEPAAERHLFRRRERPAKDDGDAVATEQPTTRRTES
jgi:hypothetical protein